MSGANVEQSRGKPTITELYDLSSDVAERKDLARERPEAVQRMTEELKAIIERGASREGMKAANDRRVSFDTIQSQRWAEALRQGD